MNRDYPPLTQDREDDCGEVPKEDTAEIDTVKSLLDRSASGRVQNSTDNCIKIFENDSRLKSKIRYNCLTERIEFDRPQVWDYTGNPTLTDTDLAFLYYYFESAYGIRCEKRIQRAISIVATQHQFHPIRDYLNALKWDGRERIRYGLHHFLGADTDEYTYQVLKLFMMGAIERIFHPGCKFEMMLCLAGDQGAGKSSFFRFLAVRDEWFSDDLRRIDDDNIYRKLQGHWIIEMSEMIATANAKSIEEIKSFLSRPKENYKVPYEVHPQDRPRQCVFGGTTNALDFLPLDRSGNRRFLPVMVSGKDAEVHILADEKASREYIDQMWAEAMYHYRQGPVRLSLSREMELYLTDFQKHFMQEDTKTGVIQAYLDACTEDQVCSKQLYREALNHAFEEPKQYEIREINDIMNHSVTGWRAFSNPRRFTGYGRQRGWERCTDPHEGDIVTASGNLSFFDIVEDCDDCPFTDNGTK